MTAWTELMTRLAARKRRIERVRLLRRAPVAVAPGARTASAALKRSLSVDEFGAPEGAFLPLIAERVSHR